jgi:hypothetical protein
LTESKQILAFPKEAIMTITLYTNGHLSINNKDTGLGVSQTQAGTIVFKREKLDGSQKYEVITLPHARYSLAHDNPASGVPGRTQFEADIQKIINQ